jgi:sulfoxide reductase heme-binding subunit YedZ
MTVDPTQHIWWLMSRASGIVALGLITASVGLGLSMSTKLLRGRNIAGLHEQLSLAGLVAIVVHGVTLLGDPWLNPGVSGIAVPFTMGYRTAFTGLGIIGGYLAAALGLSFYIRRRIGAKLWRKLHRFTPVAYVLALVHTIGAGTDASTPWLRTFMLATAVPISIMFVLRLITARRKARRPATRPAAATRGALASGGETP